MNIPLDEWSGAAATKTAARQATRMNWIMLAVTILTAAIGIGVAIYLASY